MKLFLSCRHLPNSQSWASVLMISWERTEVKVQDLPNIENLIGEPFFIKLRPLQKHPPQVQSEPEVSPVHSFPHLIPKGLQGNLSSWCRREQGFLSRCKDKQAHTHIHNSNSPHLGGPKPQGINLMNTLVWRHLGRRREGMYILLRQCISFLISKNR